MKKEWVYLQSKKPDAPQPGYYSIAVGFIDGLPSLIPGAEFKEWVNIYQDGISTVYGVKEHLNQPIQIVLKYLLDHPNFISEIKQKLIKNCQKLSDFLNTLPSSYEKISDKELWALFKKYSDLYTDAYLYGEPIAWVIKDYLPEALKKYLLEIGVEYQGETIGDIMGILASDTALSFASREELEMLSLAKKIGEDKLWNDIFALSQDEIADCLPDYEDLNTLISDHSEKWCWVPYDYGVILWDKNHFIQELKEKLKLSPTEIETKIYRFENLARDIEQQHNEIYRRNNIDRYHKDLFVSLQTSAFLMDYKKECFTKSHIAIRPLLAEVAKRYGTTYDNICYLLPSEIGDFLIDGHKIDLEIINNRIHFLCFPFSVSRTAQDLPGKRCTTLFERGRRNSQGKGS